jgi:hypothetical protein
MGYHARLGVLVGLDLDEIVAAPRLVQRSAPVQHQSLAASAHRALQQGLQRGVGGDAPLRHGLHPGLPDARDHGFHGRNALVERTPMLRQVKHHELDLAPGRIARQLLARGGLGLAEPAAARPQFAIHRCVGRPAGRKPCRGGNDFAAAGAQRVAIPVATHAVVLLADPVVRHRHARAVHIGQQQRRSVDSLHGTRSHAGEHEPGEAAAAR